jgi:hypothetical protein
VKLIQNGLSRRMFSGCLARHPGTLGPLLLYLLSDIKGTTVSVSQIMAYETSHSGEFTVSQFWTNQK